MAGADLRVLGPLQLSIDGREAVLGTPMQRAALGRLVVAHGQAVSTERLIEDLWAGHPPPKATAVLQVHIHNLRRLFEPNRPRRAPSQFIVSESSGYALKIAENAVDAWQFEHQLRTYRELVSNPEIPTPAAERNTLLEAILGHWHGPALEAFTDADWAGAEADRLTDLYLTAVELKAQTQLELGRSGDVVLELRQLFEEHPGREGIVRLLALAQYRLGQQLEALTTIRRSREFLGGEFGIDPAPALRQLEIAILNHSADLTPSISAGADPHDNRAVGPSPPARTAFESPYATGYSAELTELLTAAEVARGGRLRLAWVAGEAGIGKTVLTETALSALSDAGWITAAGTCPEIDGAPMAWAWTEILTALDAAVPARAPLPGTVQPRPPGVSHRPQLRGIAPATRSATLTGPRPTPAAALPPVTTPAVEDAFTLSRTIAEKCRAAAASGPVALLLEDVHRADPATLQVLRQVITWLRDEPVFVLVTLRRSESGAGSHNTAAALAQHTAAWLELDGLDAEGTRLIALAAGLPTVTDELVDQLHSRTGGNPLFVRELAKLFAAHGSLDQVPDSVRELIEDRIAQLPSGVTEVLQHISIWGESVDLGILSAMTGRGVDSVIDLVAAAEAAGLVGTGYAGKIRFEHGIIRDAVYLGIPPLRRGRMHWAALELLERHPDTYPAVARDPDVLARHAVQGASAETASHAVEYVLQAAAQRTNRRMRSATVSLLRAAVDLHTLARHDAEHAPYADRVALLHTRCALVTALAYDNRHREARAERDRALTLAEQLDDPDLTVRALTCWRAPVIWAIRDWRSPDHHVRQALSRALTRYGLPAPTLDMLAGKPADAMTAMHTSAISPLPESLRTAARQQAVNEKTRSAAMDSEATSHLSRQPDSGHEAPPEQQATPEGSGTAEDLVRLLVAATFETGLVEYTAGHQLALRALAVARGVDDPELLCAAINAVTYLAYEYDGEFRELVTELERVATAAGLAEYRALAHCLGYRAAMAHAQLREAGRRAITAMEFADEGQLQPLLDMVDCFGATTELLRGDVDRAAELYRRFTTRARQSGMANQIEAELFCALSIGWARKELGSLVDRLAEAYTALPEEMAPGYTLALLQAGDRERARAVFDASDPIRAGFHPVLGSALRAVAAIEIGDGQAIQQLYEYLAPHTGTLIGIETGMAEFGPMDSVLAALAEAMGDPVTAADHRERARDLLERIRTELPRMSSPAGVPRPRMSDMPGNR
ncbi:BTAD domain-containing putative transcriptional regulator [Nocardia sp. NBC_00511]|uniref:BTAD domain-containing putative transcriptional regulator n=1 Tax=Nocardia sp. NBC_00511 TaxID=2903591 RepID=UPI0030DE2E18